MHLFLKLFILVKQAYVKQLLLPAASGDDMERISPLPYVQF